MDRPQGLSVGEVKDALEQHPADPVIDLDEFQKNVSWLNFACERAISIFNAEDNSDPGGRKADQALYGLLVNLDSIYDQAEENTRGKIRFIHEAIKLVREDIRPNPMTDDALRKAIASAKNFYPSDKIRKENPD